MSRWRFCDLGDSGRDLSVQSYGRAGQSVSQGCVCSVSTRLHTIVDLTHGVNPVATSESERQPERDESQPRYTFQWPDGRIQDGVAASDLEEYIKHSNRLRGARVKMGEKWISLSEVGDLDEWTSDRMRDQGVKWRGDRHKRGLGGVDKHTLEARNKAACLHLSLLCVLVPFVGWLVPYQIWKRTSETEEVRTTRWSAADWAITVMMVEIGLVLLWWLMKLFNLPAQVSSQVVFYAILGAAIWYLPQPLIAIIAIERGKPPRYLWVGPNPIAAEEVAGSKAACHPTSGSGRREPR